MSASRWFPSHRTSRLAPTGSSRRPCLSDRVEEVSDVELLTVGHGTMPQEEFADLLRRADLELLVDVRTAPGSRRHPHFAREAMESWMPETGIAYRWEPRLGGWRKPIPDSPNRALRNESFRGYADYMRS